MEDGFSVIFFIRWLHVLSGVMWIGLLWYFNFVQIPSMPKIPDEQKPAIGKVIAPEALFWFRWSALSTVVFGVLLAGMNGYLVDGLLLGINGQVAGHAMIGFGMWLGLIMAFNVWFVIWPRQHVRQCCFHEPTRCCRYPCFTPWWRHRICSKLLNFRFCKHYDPAACEWPGLFVENCRRSTWGKQEEVPRQTLRVIKSSSVWVSRLAGPDYAVSTCLSWKRFQSVLSL